MKKNQLFFALVYSMSLVFAQTIFATDSLFIDSNGRVGIGTSTPQYKLQLQADSDPWPYGGLYFEPIASDSLGFNYFGGNGGYGFSLYGTGLNSPYANTQLNLGSDGVINFMSGDGSNYPTSKIYVATSGNVGIGTSYPGYGLHVSENDSNIAVYAHNSQASANNYGVYGVADGSGTSNFGVYGYAANASSTNYAGYFSGDVYGTGNASFASFTDRTPFYEGNALLEITKISGKDGEIDHSTLPDFAHVEKEMPLFEETELIEITTEEAFETVKVEGVKFVETENEKGKIIKNKIRKGTKIVSKGYKIEDGKIIDRIEEMPIYETELVDKKRLKKDVYFNEKTGKVYQKAGEGEIFVRDDKIYQNKQIGTKIEEQRDIGAMVSILTVAVQQLDEQNKLLKNELCKKDKMYSFCKSKL